MLHSVSSSNGRVAAMSLGAVAGVYLAWLWSSLPGSGKKTPPGLYNYGNTCFVNSLLQSLASCSSFLSYLDTAPHRRLSGALSSVLLQLSQLSDDTVDPSDFYTAVREAGWTISTSQDDSVLFFQGLMEALGESDTQSGLNLLEVSSRRLSQLSESQLGFDDSLLSSASSILGRTGEYDDIARPISNPFSGLLAVKLTCSRCHYSYPVRLELFSFLPLRGDVRTPSDAITQLSSHVERIPDGVCEKCNARGFLSKRERLARLPQCLALQVSSVSWDPAAGAVKISGRLEPEVIVKIPKHLRHVASGDCSYRLAAVVEHTGVASSGHYTSFRCLRVPHDASYTSSQSGPDVVRSVVERWFSVSDETVRSCPRREVLACAPYLLFYERISVEGWITH